MDDEHWIEMRPSTALLIMPTWWGERIQRAVQMGATTVRFPRHVVVGVKRPRIAVYGMDLRKEARR